MQLRLRVIEGQRKGEEFSIKGEIKIGRSRAHTDLTINDSKASSLHSRIFVKDNKLYFIEDLGSSNGTYVNGERLSAARELALGDIIAVGRTQLEVIELVLDKGTFEAGSWQQKIDLALQDSMELYEKQSPAKSQFGYFKHPVSVEIISGGPMKTQYVFSFGPRSVGQLSAEAPILIKDFPERAFDLTPKNEHCVLSTGLADLKINSKVTSEAILKDGDIISVGQTEFIVKFIKNL